MFFSDKFAILFWYFLQELKTKYLSPNQHAEYSYVTQFELPLKLKPSRQDTIET